MEKQRWEESEKTREEKKREDQRRERVRRKKMQVREKVEMSRNTAFFKWFVAPAGRKVDLLKRRVRSRLAIWPLWREADFEVKTHKTPQLRSTFKSWDDLRCRKSARCYGTKQAHFEVKTYKAHQRRTTFGSWDVEKVHAVVVRSTFPSQNVQSTPAPDHFWKLRCRKSAVYVVVVRSTFPIQNVQRHNMLEPLLKVQMWFCVAGARNLCALPNVSKTWGFCSISKSDGRHGTFAEDLQRCISRGRRCARDMKALISWDGLNFGVSDLQFAWQVQHFIWPGIAFSWRAQRFRQMECKNCKAHWYEAVSSALNFPFFWRKSRRIASFLTLSGSKVEEVSQNCCVFKLANRQIDR